MSAPGEIVQLYETVQDEFHLPDPVVPDQKRAELGDLGLKPVRHRIRVLQYPEDLVGTMTKAGIKVDALDCLTLAEQAGTAKSVNIVLMGRLSKYMDFPVDDWMSAIEKLVKPQFLEMNKKAFMLGRGE